MSSRMGPWKLSQPNVIIGPIKGSGVLFGTPATDIIITFGQNNEIFGQGGNDFVYAGSGSAFVDLGVGNATVILGGGNNIVGSPGGNVTVLGGPAGHNAIELGDGNNVVRVGGTNDEILLGNGSNIVSGTQGMAFISTGAGNDRIHIGGGYNVVNAGAGTNSISGGTGHNIFVLPEAGNGLDKISGFTLTNGDLLDLQPSLAATSWTGDLATLNRYLLVTTSKGHTTLSIASHGTGSGAPVAVLSDAGHLGLSDLLSHNSIFTG